MLTVYRRKKKIGQIFCFVGGEMASSATVPLHEYRRRISLGPISGPEELEAFLYKSQAEHDNHTFSQQASSSSSASIGAAAASSSLSPKGSNLPHGKEPPYSLVVLGMLEIFLISMEAIADRGKGNKPPKWELVWKHEIDGLILVSF
jgi:hypothetical protein